jgi:hypothetical protein
MGRAAWGRSALTGARWLGRGARIRSARSKASEDMWGLFGSAIDSVDWPGA